MPFGDAICHHLAPLRFPFNSEDLGDAFGRPNLGGVSGEVWALGGDPRGAHVFSALPLLLGDGAVGLAALRPIGLEDFQQACKEVGGSVNEESAAIAELRKWNAAYGGLGT